MRCKNGLVASLLVAALVPLPNMYQASAQGTEKTTAIFRVGPGDIIKIAVYGTTDYDTVTQIAPDGTVPINELGLVKVDQLTPSEISIKLAAEFRSRGILINPIVNVGIQEYRSQTIFVLGSVGKPGEYPLDRSGLKITDMLARAGANLGLGGGTVSITNEAGVRTDLSVSKILSGETDYPLHPHDTVVVNEAATFYISGEVQKAGSYQIEPGLTIGRAVALAGGLTARGSRNKLKVTRATEDGKEVVRKAKAGDAVLSRDLIIVGARIF